MFVRQDSIIPLGPEMNYVGEKPFEPLTLDIYIDKKAEFVLYDDQETIKFKCYKGKDQINFSISKSSKDYILNLNNAHTPL